MTKDAHGSTGWKTALQPDVTLRRVIDGKNVRAPAKFTFAELEQRMVVDFQCDENRVRAIIKQVEDQGWCGLVGNSGTEAFIIEKVLAS
jgi:hypothetical protein